MTWRLLLLAMCMVSSLLHLVRCLPRSPATMETPGFTTKSGGGWGLTLPLQPAPQGRPYRRTLAAKQTSTVIWTTPQILQQSAWCYPVWAPRRNHAGDHFPSEGTIAWWPWQRPVHSVSTMQCSAPPKELCQTPQNPGNFGWLTCTPWTDFLVAPVYGPASGSPRRLLGHLLGRERAAHDGNCDAYARWFSGTQPIWAVPGPKSGPHFCVPSLQTPCQVRGARVAGYPASGPAGAATSALLQLSHNGAKLRGRQFYVIPRIFAASTCCTRCTDVSTQVVPIILDDVTCPCLFMAPLLRFGLTNCLSLLSAAHFSLQLSTGPCFGPLQGSRSRQHTPASLRWISTEIGCMLGYSNRACLL